MNPRITNIFYKLIVFIFLQINIITISIGQNFEISCEDLESDSVFVLNTIDNKSWKGPSYRYDSWSNKTLKYYNNGYKENSTNISMVNGVYPYTMSNGTYTERGIESTTNTAYYSKPGLYKIMISESTGLKDSCFSKVHMPHVIEFTSAAKNKIAYLKQFLTSTFSVNGFSIKYEFNSQSGVVQTFEDLPDTCMNCKNIVLSFLDSNDMKEYHQLIVNIDLYSVGDSCDDNDPCTINDIIRENGECIGKSKIDSFELYTSFDENCHSKKVTIYTANNYPYQEWSDGTNNSRSMTASIFEPTFVSVTVRDKNGCEMSQEIEIQPKTSVTINAEKKFICSDESIRLSISESEKYKKIVWQDEFGNFIDTLNHYIDVDKEGIYSVRLFTKDCYKKGDITIESHTYLTKNKIYCENNLLCDGTVLLTLKPKVDFSRNEGEVIWKYLSYDDYASDIDEWEIIGSNTNSIVAKEAGVYSIDLLSPTIPNSCRSASYDEIRIFDASSYKLIQKHFRQLGLHELIFEFDRFDTTEYHLKSENNYLGYILDFGGLDKGFWLKTLDSKHRFHFQKQVNNHLEKLSGLTTNNLLGMVRNINCIDLTDLNTLVDPAIKNELAYICLYFIEEPKDSNPQKLVHVFILGGVGSFIPSLYDDSLKVSKKKIDKKNKSSEQNMDVFTNGLFSYSDYEKGLNASKELNKPLLLYFNAFGSPNAKRMEDGFLWESSIQEYINNRFIVVNLKVDDRTKIKEEDTYFSSTLNKQVANIGNINLEHLMKVYNTNREPLFVIIKPNGKEIKRIGFTQNIDEFLSFLKSIEN